MIVVSDTTPLNFLIQLGLVELLPQLFGEVVIPPAVSAELAHPSSVVTVREWLNSPPAWLSTKYPAVVRTDGLPEGAGERAAISLALELNADLLLADDRRARNCAGSLGIAVTGTLGVLDLAARRGFIDLSDAFSKLRQTNFHVSEELLATILMRSLRESSGQ